MKPEDLTDEQFREARRQIVVRFRYAASQRSRDAQVAIAADCANFQNEPSPRAILARDESRAAARAADAVAQMEREGFDYGEK